MRRSVNSWNKVWLVLLAVAAFALAQVTQAQALAWGFYAGAHGGRAMVYENDTDLHAGGTSPAREEVVFQSGNSGSFSAMAYIKYITGFDFDHNPFPWPGGEAARNNLSTALVTFLCSDYYSDLPNGSLRVSLFHISDDSWDADDPLFNYANSPYFNNPATATLLDTQVVTGNNRVTWNLLSNNLYQDIWKTQDFDDRTISVILKVDDISGNVGKAALLESGGFSISLEGARPTPLPSAIFLVGSGLAGLGLRSVQRWRRKL